MDEVPTKVRTGYCRKSARSLLTRFTKVEGKIELPVPVSRIAEYLEYRVYLLSGLPDEHSAIVDFTEKLIGLNKNHHFHRRRFSVGHELGHICMGHPPEDEQTDEEIALFNAEANMFSGELLVPLDLLKTELKKGYSVDELSRSFAVSTEVVFRRIREQGLLSLL